MNSPTPYAPPPILQQPPQAPAAPVLAPDPALAQLTQQAQADSFKAASTEAAGDTAAIMARYGRVQAYSGAAPSAPLTAPAVGPLSGAAFLANLGRGG